MDSETYSGELARRERQDAGDAGTQRSHDGVQGAPTGRLRAALLIVFAIVALSAFAAIGWMQYQANDGDHDPQIEIGAPDRSVPALAEASGGD